MRKRHQSSRSARNTGNPNWTWDGQGIALCFGRSVTGHFVCRVSKTLGRQVGGCLLLLYMSVYFVCRCQRRSKDKCVCVWGGGGGGGGGWGGWGGVGGGWGWGGGGWVGGGEWCLLSHHCQRRSYYINTSSHSWHSSDLSPRTMWTLTV